MIFDKRYFEYQKQGELEHAALKRLSNIGELSLYKHEGFWYAVDTNKEYEDLNKIWRSGQAPWKIWK
jgi:glucose-1-phosphate cytidylyltransferase